MKKILFILFAVLPVMAMAQTMCVRDNSLVISLDYTIKATAMGHNPSEHIWWADYPYGRIYGEATYLSSDESLGQTVQGSFYGTGEYSNTKIIAKPGLSGTDENGNERTSCWCRMTHPAQSLWVLNTTNRTYSCVASCANNMHLNYPSLHKGIFNSVGL